MKRTRGAAQTKDRGPRRPRSRSTERLAFLEQLRPVLCSGAAPIAMLQHVARLAARSLGEFCVVDHVDEGRVRRLEIAHADASLIDRLRVAADAFAPRPGGRVERILATGDTGLVTGDRPRSSAATSSARHAGDRESASAVRTRAGDFWDGFAPASYVSVPILVFGEIGAILTLASRRPSRFDADRLAFAVEVAGWCGLALEARRSPHPRSVKTVRPMTGRTGKLASS